MYKKHSKKIVNTILQSLRKGSTINSACEHADIDVVTFWLWRKRDKSLDDEVKSIYDSRIQIVEDALYKSALDGSNTAQIFFLKNRDVNRWRDKTEQELTGAKGEPLIPPVINYIGVACKK